LQLSSQLPQNNQVGDLLTRRSFSTNVAATPITQPPAGDVFAPYPVIADDRRSLFEQRFHATIEKLKTLQTPQIRNINQGIDSNQQSAIKFQQDTMLISPSTLLVSPLNTTTPTPTPTPTPTRTPTPTPLFTASPNVQNAAALSSFNTSNLAIQYQTFMNPSIQATPILASRSQPYVPPIASQATQASPQFSTPPLTRATPTSLLTIAPSTNISTPFSTTMPLSISPSPSQTLETTQQTLPENFQSVAYNPTPKTLVPQFPSQFSSIGPTIKNLALGCVSHYPASLVEVQQVLENKTLTEKQQQELIAKIIHNHSASSTKK
jgi:hypothetical protein